MSAADRLLRLEAALDAVNAALERRDLAALEEALAAQVDAVEALRGAPLPHTPELRDLAARVRRLAASTEARIGLLFDLNERRRAALFGVAEPASYGADGTVTPASATRPIGSA